MENTPSTGGRLPGNDCRHVTVLDISIMSEDNLDNKEDTHDNTI